MNPAIRESGESPEYLRMSLAAAMTLGLQPGLFYRNAKLHCINLLATYHTGCAARCSYCGLSGSRAGAPAEKSFIRVTWPTYSLDEIIRSISLRQERVKRICLAMLTRRRSVVDTKAICARLRACFEIPVSLLISPTVVSYQDLIDFKAAGADRIGVAIDLATPELFDRHRGSGTGGPHRWERYWDCLQEALEVFGDGHAGSHFMVGMGETEREMGEAIQRVRDTGGRTHLFSFFPEVDSALATHPQPPMGQYRRIQLARFLIDKGLSRAERFRYDGGGRLVDFGMDGDALEAIVASGEPFRTSGCEGNDGEVACNRPYANSRPGPEIRNFPFRPNKADLGRIRRQMRSSDPTRAGSRELD